jgi:hypothetical protein
MDLTPYLEALRRDLAASAAPAGEEAARTADLLGGALEAAARLCLLEALSDAAAEITTKLPDRSVEVRLRGREADLVVTEGAAPATAPPPPPAEGGDVARITLRLPEPLKDQAERAAAAEGISVNAWLVRAVSAALHGGFPGPFGGPGAAFPFPPPPPHPPQPPPPPHGRGRGRRMTGYAQA